ncbi:hypothetical protein OSB04_030730 [Centaurea solstitialis]|uniref:Glycosyltransferase n=1 Tax=Centaurea solstitialis TaxID=347529 RepID=A0AA38VTL6_9ASTR|nr:hypothetical protein OSB04_030730 [Centaurea solstitialis]
MASKEDLVHVFLVTFPAQGHVNPLLRLGKLIASKRNLLVTFSTTKSIGNQMKKAGASVSGDPTPVGNRGGMIRFEFFDDECADEEIHDLEKYLPKLEAYGKRSLAGIINRHAQEGRPVSCLINNPFMPWVSDLGEELNIPSAMLWVQSCACFSSYYHYEHSSVPFPSEKQPDIDIQMPNMPLLKSDEVPSFLHPSTPYPFLKRAVLGQFKNLSKTFCVLMETFQELEGDLINYMSKICQIRPVGPLFKNPLLETSSDISGDMIKADDCLEWLDSKQPSSVVYISFGSIVRLSQEQMAEIAFGVLNSGVSFLWVVRKGYAFNGLPEGFMEAAGDRGIVSTSPGVVPPGGVVFRDSLRVELYVGGVIERCSGGSVPAVGDQVTDAKYLVDEWKVGIRMCRGDAENRLVGREEIKECLMEATEGVKAEEMKNNALKWKKAAEEAVEEGGSSDLNIQEFVDEIKKISQSMGGPK